MSKLPVGSHYAVTFDIKPNFGGMTSALLHRSRAFVAAGAEVSVLTYAFADMRAVRKQLEDLGELVPGLTVRNLFEDLRSWTDLDLQEAGGFSPGLHTAIEGLEPVAEPGLRRSHEGAQGVEIVEYYREDGTLLLTDQRGIAGRKRAVALFNLNGEPLGAWPSIWDLYHCWLDSLPRNPTAYFIVDSKTAANHMVRYRRDDAVVMHLVHGNHVEDGELLESRKGVFDQLDNFDAVVFLTNKQRIDAAGRCGQGSNRHVVPNSRHIPALDRPIRRVKDGTMLASLTPRQQVRRAISALRRNRRSGGVMLAALNRNKQVGHAIEASATARKVTLAIYGEGSQEAALRRQIKRLGIKKRVTLEGYSPTAVDGFSSASFSLLTSRSEAFGLVIIESMARGCIPISYEIDYGPGELITDGVDGFLVPPDNIPALAAAIRRVSTMSSTELAAMRRAARQRALDFSDSAVIEKWATVMTQTATAKCSPLVVAA